LQQPMVPATTYLSRSCLLERSPVTFAFGLSGAALLPAFLTAYRTGVTGPRAICLFSGAGCRDRRRGIVVANSELFLSRRFERQPEKTSVRLNSGKLRAGQEFIETDETAGLPRYSLGGDKVNGTPTTPFTLPFTRSFTTKASRNHGNYIGCVSHNDVFVRGQNTGLGWSDPTLLPPKPWRSLQPITLIAWHCLTRVPRNRDDAGSAIIGD
jgi:hypothetical protein